MVSREQLQLLLLKGQENIVVFQKLISHRPDFSHFGPTEYVL